MKDQHLQKYKKIIGKSNGKDYILQLEDDSIHFTIIDKSTLAQRFCLLTSDQLKKMEILSNQLKTPDNLMSYFAAIKEQGKYDFIEVLPNQNILVKIRSRKMQMFSVTLQTKPRERDAQITLDSQGLAHMIELVVQEKINIYKKQREAQQKRIGASPSVLPKKSRFKIGNLLMIIVIVLLIYCSYSLMNNPSSSQDSIKLQQQLLDITQRINQMAQSIDKLKQQYQSQLNKISYLQNSISQDRSKNNKQIDESRQFQSAMKMKLRMMDQQINQVNSKLSMITGHQGGGGHHHRRHHG